MKRIISILAISMLVASCTTTYHFQVLETTSDNPKIKTDEKQTEYEDENCIIIYDMWEKNGKAGFYFYNKTDQIITIDLEKSFFVRNGEAFDYYRQEILNTGSSVSLTRGGATYWGYGISTANSKQVANSTQLTVFAPTTIVIPPKCYKEISKFEIKDEIIRTCDLNINPAKRSVPVHFDKENSPFKFSNIITYSVGDAKPITISNDFYVHTIFNVISWEFYRYETKRNCDFRGEPNVSVKYFFMNPRNGFYIKYVASDYRNEAP